MGGWMPRILSAQDIKDFGLNIVKEHLLKQGYTIVAISTRGEYYLVRAEKEDAASLVVVFTTTYPNRAEDHEVYDIQYFHDFAESNDLLLRFAGVSLIDIDAMSGVLTDESTIIVNFKGLVDL